MTEGLRDDYAGWDIQQPAPRPDRRRSEMLASLDPVKAYLSQLGRTPLLNAEEEVDLAKRIEAGVFAGKLLAAKEKPEDVPEIDAEKVISTLDETTSWPQLKRDLKELERDGARAKNHLMEANLRLVVSVAKHYTGSSMPFLDLIQEGNVGLVRAVEKFDYTKGFKFSTYATWWIRQGITRAIADKDRDIRLPARLAEQVNKTIRTQRRLNGLLEREPTTEELAAELEMSVAEVLELLKHAPRTISYNQLVGAKGPNGAELADFIEDADAVDPEEAAASSLLPLTIKAYLDARLGPMEDASRKRQVIEWRFGLDGNPPRTLEVIGKHFRLSRERVRQIEREAMGELRVNAPEGLKHYLGIMDTAED